ncbi:hypothetical protein ACFVT2_20730 [Streptomyces sp. NPDC058000]|uniref:hypothetical protein n=1 Tax=Streptomyces sp. NPDC058000 TaxID=3346299 RepID=UPI0036EFCD04
MFGLGEGRAVLAALGQGVGVHDAEQGFGLGIHPSLGPVQARVAVITAAFTLLVAALT